MKVYIQELLCGYPKSINEYNAWDGFHELGIETFGFRTIDDLQSVSPENIVVGGIRTVSDHLQNCGVTLRGLDYPSELTKYLGRKIWKSTVNTVVEYEKWPIFVKSVQEKMFSGIVLRNMSDLSRCGFSTADCDVYCSEVIDIIAEWRVFIRYGKIIDIKQYKGDWHTQYDSNVIAKAVDDYRSAPAGYALDFGATPEGNTIMIEANDAYSLGCYGLDPVLYAELLSARWAELTGTIDVLQDCDDYVVF